MSYSFFRHAAAPAAIAALILSLVSPLAAYADDDDAAPPAAGIGVARLSVADGSVAIQRGDSNTTVAAVVNAPILGADYVTTGDDARAEVQFDANTMVRLGDNVQARFSHIDANDRAIQLAVGSIDVRLLGGTDGRTTVDTPSISVVPQSSGSYRISVDGDGTTQVTVRSGHASIVTPGGTRDLGTGITLVASGPAANPQVQDADAIAYDDFDSFNHDRDVLEQRALAQAPYVNDTIGGVADLAQYGNWVPDSSYGQVWIPANVAPGWAPYSNGNWAWEDSYGWTWVGSEPWGWAPYHYGRWYYSTAYHNWAWYPPRPGYAVPAWSPALVGFIGFNIGAVNVGIGFGNIGWVPLAPYEAFHPWWGARGTTIVNNVSYTNVYVHNVNNFTTTGASYRNINVHNAVTSISTQNFRAGRFGLAAPVSAAQLHGYNAVAVRGTLPIVPTAANLRYADRNAVVAFHQPAFTQRFAGAPVATQRTPFATQQANVAYATRAPMPAAGPHETSASFTHAAAVPSYAHTAPETGTFTHAAPATENAHASALPNTSSSYAHAAPAAANDPWARFNAGRNTTLAPHGSAYAHSDNAAMPASSSRLTQTGYRTPSASTVTRPSSYGTEPNAQHAAPISTRPEGSTYGRPAQTYNEQTPSTYSHAAPSYGQAPAYNRPSQTYGQAPSYGHAAPSYSHAAPSYGQAPAYSRAAPSYGQAPASSHAAPANYGHGAPASTSHESRGGGEQRQH